MVVIHIIFIYAVSESWEMNSHSAILKVKEKTATLLRKIVKIKAPGFYLKIDFNE